LSDPDRPNGTIARHPFGIVWVAGEDHDLAMRQSADRRAEVRVGGRAPAR
jgi:hypothetical protein